MNLGETQPISAREMGRKAFEKRLEEIKMSEYDAKRYDEFVSGVKGEISALKQVPPSPFQQTSNSFFN